MTKGTGEAAAPAAKCVSAIARLEVRMQREDVIREIYGALRRANAMRGADAQLACAEDTALYGRSGGLTSLDFVALILDIEEAVNAQSGAGVVLADERAMSLRHNPFRDVGSLADHVMARLGEANP